MPEAPSPRTRVLVAGDANPDLVLRGDVTPRFGQAEQLLDEAALVIGGSAGITAHGFARLGRPTSLVAVVGADAFGERARQALEAGGVDTSAFRVDPAVPTGLSVILSRPEDRAILTLLGTIPALSADDVRAAVTAVAPAHVHVSSYYLMNADFLAALPAVFRELRAAGVSTSLDTNDDPAREWRHLSELLPHVDVLLPNESEARGLGGDQDPRSAATALAARGPLVVVKAGGDGAFAATPDGALVDCPGTPVPVVDTTGAGDTFNAAFVDAWLAGRALEECLARGVRAGALAVGATGGTAGQPTAADLDGR